MDCGLPGPSLCGISQAGVGCHFLFQGIFPTQGLNLSLPHWLTGSLPLCHQWNPSGSAEICVVEKIGWGVGACLFACGPARCFPWFYIYVLRDELEWGRFLKADKFIDFKKYKTWWKEPWVVASFDLGTLFVERQASMSSFAWKIMLLSFCGTHSSISTLTNPWWGQAWENQECPCRFPGLSWTNDPFAFLVPQRRLETGLVTGNWLSKQHVQVCSRSS